VSFNDYSEINTDEGEQDILKEFDEDVFESRYDGSL